MAAELNIEFAQEFSSQLTVHKNLGQEVVVTTVDKVRLCLMQNEAHLRGQRDWITPLSLLLASCTTLLAAEFKNVGLAKEVWQSLYILGSIACLIWLIKAATAAWRYRNKASIDAIVHELKASGLPAAATPTAN